MQFNPFAALSAAILALMLQTTPALSQTDDAATEADAPATAETQAPAEQPAGDAENSPQIEIDVVEQFGDWQHRCIRPPNSEELCQIFQPITDEDGGLVSTVVVLAVEPGGAAAAGMTVNVPLETLLSEDLVIRIDNGEAKRFRFTLCDGTACSAQFGLTAEDLADFKAGNTAFMRIVSLLPPRPREVVLELSLSGFTAGFSSLTGQ